MGYSLHCWNFHAGLEIASAVRLLLAEMVNHPACPDLPV